MNPALYSAKLGCAEARTLCASAPNPALPRAGLGLPRSSEAERSSEDNKWACYSRGSKEPQNPRILVSLLSAQEPHVRRMEFPMHTPLWLGKQVRPFHPASVPHAQSV